MPPSKKAVKAPKRQNKTQEHSRVDLVGKFLHSRHQPTPKAKLLLSEEVHRQILARMKLQ